MSIQVLTPEQNERLKILETAGMLRQTARDWNCIADLAHAVALTMSRECIELALPEPNVITDSAIDLANKARALAFKFDIAARRIEDKHKITKGDA